MDAFSFVFSLFSILLGLALAEVLGGFGKALQSRRKVHIGWLSPLLGAMLAFDITSFWALAWQVRDQIPAKIFVLFCGLVVTGLYYLVARIAFPDDPAEWPDYDVYYFAHKRLVLGGVILCNLMAAGAEIALGHNPWGTVFGAAESVEFYVPLAVAMWVRSKPLSISLLAFMLAGYPVFSLIEFLR